MYAGTDGHFHFDHLLCTLVAAHEWGRTMAVNMGQRQTECSVLYVVVSFGFAFAGGDAGCWCLIHYAGQ